MRVGVVGGRDRDDKAVIEKVMRDFLVAGDVVVSGGAKGVDAIVKNYALHHGYEFVEFVPDLSAGRRGYLDRNTDIAEFVDVLIAFPSMNSRGTWHTVAEVRKLMKRVIIWEP